MNEPTTTATVTITDINIPTGRMVAILLKFAVACIPALLVLAALGFVVSAVAAGLIQSLVGL